MSNLLDNLVRTGKGFFRTGNGMKGGFAPGMNNSSLGSNSTTQVYPPPSSEQTGQEVYPRGDEFPTDETDDQYPDGVHMYIGA